VRRSCSRGATFVDYPFETYKATIQLLAIQGTDPNVPQNTTRPRLAIGGVFATNAAGFSIAPQSHVGKDDVASINFVIRRTLGNPADGSWP